MAVCSFGHLGLRAGIHGAGGKPAPCSSGEGDAGCRGPAKTTLAEVCRQTFRSIPRAEDIATVVSEAVGRNRQQTF